MVAVIIGLTLVLLVVVRQILFLFYWAYTQPGFVIQSKFNGKTPLGLFYGSDYYQRKAMQR